MNVRSIIARLLGQAECPRLRGVPEAWLNTEVHVNTITSRTNGENITDVDERLVKVFSGQCDGVHETSAKHGADMVMACTEGTAIPFYMVVGSIYTPKKSIAGCVQRRNEFHTRRDGWYMANMKSPIVQPGMKTYQTSCVAGVKGIPVLVVLMEVDRGTHQPPTCELKASKDGSIDVVLRIGMQELSNFFGHDFKVYTVRCCYGDTVMLVINGLVRVEFSCSCKDLWTCNLYKTCVE